MSPDDHEAFDSAIDQLRELGQPTLERASTQLTQYAARVQQSDPDLGLAVLLAARTLYVLAHETPGERIG